jgi:hypothetical protein
LQQSSALHYTKKHLMLLSKQMKYFSMQETIKFRIKHIQTGMSNVSTISLKVMSHMITTYVLLLFTIFTLNLTYAADLVLSEETPATEEKTNKNKLDNTQIDKKKLDNIKFTAEQTVKKLGWVISSGEYEQIKGFWTHNTLQNAKIFQESSLYLTPNEEPIYTTSMTLQPNECVSYIYESQKIAKNYMRETKIEDFSHDTNSNTSVVTTAITEYYKQSVEKNIDLNVKVLTSCNVTLVHRNTAYISGLNCIENIFATVIKNGTAQKIKLQKT